MNDETVEALVSQLIAAPRDSYRRDDMLARAREVDAEIARLRELLKEATTRRCSACGFTGYRDDVNDRARAALGETA